MENPKLRNQEIAELYRAGKTMQQLAEQFNISKERVRQILGSIGVAVRKTGLIPKAPKTMKPPKPSSEAERFWSFVEKTGRQDECWNWTGNKDVRGYGRFYWKKQQTHAHRIAFELAHGKPTLVVMNTCHNRACCNPAHLREATRAECMEYRDQSGRNAFQKDREGMRAKLQAAARGRKKPGTR